jgi:hypothetical protein
MTTLTMVYQLQDKIDVAHFLGLQFQDLAHLDQYQWHDMRTYAKRGGLKI